MSTDVASLPSKPAARLGGLSGLGALPGARQLMLLVGIAAAVAIGISLALWMRTPDFSLLFGGLGSKDAMAVTQALNGLGEPYRIGPDGHSVLIPSGDLAAVRMKLAAQGLPRGNASLQGGAAGSSSSSSTFGLSDFAERMRYQANLEGNLGSTIASLQSISAARVHLAMPKFSAFLRDRQPASASVVVSLYAGRTLSSGQVAAIVHLVASSVPGLDARHVSVVDQSGNLLTNGSPNGVAAQANRRFRIAQMVENNYARRIVAILTPIVGARHVRAQVVANLDFTQTEKTSEIYNGQKPALRSEQTSSHRELASAAAGGVPGALSNQPPVTPVQATAAKPVAGTAATPARSSSAARLQPVNVSSTATRNYDLNRTISHVRDAIGDITHLSVAVLLDDRMVAGKGGKLQAKPYSAKELAQITTLVKNAVGFNAARGDVVSVINAAFQIIPVVKPVQHSTPLWDTPGFRGLLKLGIGAMLMLVLILAVLRPLLKSLLRGNPGSHQPGQAALTVSKTEPADQLSLGNSAEPTEAAMAYEQKLALAQRTANQDPRQVAQVVQNWVAEDG